MSIETHAEHIKLPLQIKPGAVVVLEGLDATGKSTQHEKLERACMGMGHGSTPLFDPVPLFAHMPSAGTHVGQAIYDLTESVGKDLDPLARQYLHLASHAQSVQHLIRPAIDSGQPVILDRWWWSTMAYGFFGGRLRRNRGIGRTAFLDLCKMTWEGVDADLICVFLHPHVEDRHNTPHVLKGYEWLANEFPDAVELIEPGDEGEQGEQVFTAMLRRGLYGTGK